MRELFKDVRYLLKKAREERAINELVTGYERQLKDAATRGAPLPLNPEPIHFTYRARFLSQEGKDRLRAEAARLHARYTLVSDATRVIDKRIRDYGKGAGKPPAPRRPEIRPTQGPGK